MPNAPRSTYVLQQWVLLASVAGLCGVLLDWRTEIECLPGVSLARSCRHRFDTLFLWQPTADTAAAAAVGTAVQLFMCSSITAAVDQHEKLSVVYVVAHGGRCWGTLRVALFVSM